MDKQYPYTKLISPSVAWYPAHLDVLNGLGAPKDAASPNKPWRDNAVLTTGGSWWAPPEAVDKTYRVLADNLTPIGSPEFFATYNLTQVKTYQEYAFLFPFGVPYLVDEIVPAKYGQTLNFGGSDPGYKYPVELRGDFLLLPASWGSDGQVQCIGYQNFIAQATPKGLSYEQMLAVVDTVRRSGQPAEYQVRQIRLALQNSPKPDPLI